MLNRNTPEPFVRDPSPFEAEIAIAMLKRYNSPGSDQIPAELIQAGGETSQSEIHTLINYIWNKEELPDQWKESAIVRIYEKGSKTDCSNYRGISLLSTSYKMLSFSQGLMKLLGIISVVFDNRSTTDQVLCICQILEKTQSTMRQCISYS
jgi:hypothetical protein